MTCPPPFIAGQIAFKGGQTQADNPHKFNNERGDAYPGPAMNWRAGWQHAEALEFHKQETKA